MRSERGESRHCREVIRCMPVVELIGIDGHIRPLRPQSIDMTISAGAYMRPGQIESHRWIADWRVLGQNRLNGALGIVWTTCIFETGVGRRNIRDVLGLIDRSLRRAA